MFSSKLFVPLRLRLEVRLHLGNENKYGFILHFARFALTLSPQIINQKKKQI